MTDRMNRIKTSKKKFVNHRGICRHKTPEIGMPHSLQYDKRSMRTNVFSLTAAVVVCMLMHITYSLPPVLICVWRQRLLWTASHCGASPAVNFQAWDSISGVQLCPQVLTLKKVHGNCPISLLLIKYLSERLPLRMFSFFLFRPNIFYTYTVISKTVFAKASTERWHHLQI